MGRCRCARGRQGLPAFEGACRHAQTRGRAACTRSASRPWCLSGARRVESQPSRRRISTAGGTSPDHRPPWRQEQSGRLGARGTWHDQRQLRGRSLWCVDGRRRARKYDRQSHDSRLVFDRVPGRILPVAARKQLFSNTGSLLLRARLSDFSCAMCPVFGRPISAKTAESSNRLP